MKIETVVIDIGHKTDTYEKKHMKGCVLNGVKIEEYDLNKLIAVDLYSVLKEQGCNVHYSTKLDDKEPENFDERINNINEHKPDLSISIHHDYSNSSSTRGFTIYTYRNNNNSKTIKDRITAQMKTICNESELNYNGYSICYSGHQNFAIVRKPKCNSMLIECGYFSSQVDVNLTKNAHDKIAKLIAKGILGNQWKGDKPVVTFDDWKTIIKKDLSNPQVWTDIANGLIEIGNNNSKGLDLLIEHRSSLKYFSNCIEKIDGNRQHWQDVITNDTTSPAIWIDIAQGLIEIGEGDSKGLDLLVRHRSSLKYFSNFIEKINS